jgi:5-methylcytosine-specific restriction protein A
MNMKQSNALALIVAYYLSKYDDLAYEQLGFKKGQKTAAHKELGRILGVNSNSVKNMRDEFDPIHDNPRAGWHQRPLRPSRAKVVEQFQEMTQEEIRDFVLELLTNPKFSHTEEVEEIWSAPVFRTRCYERLGCVVGV